MNKEDTLFDDIRKTLQIKQEEHKTQVIDSDHYQLEIKYLSDFSLDAIQTIRSISFYSTRAKHIYDNLLTINASDDYLQSIIGIRSLVLDGIHNMVIRELRYLIEMTVKYLVVDQELSGKDLNTKLQYLSSDIPNASIDVIDRMDSPFDTNLEQEFKSEVKDLFYKACAYVHPSKKQIEKQLINITDGNTIGFETAKMLSKTNRLVCRAYDMILTMLFHGFGKSMSGDLFINVYDSEKSWKYHSGKYVKQYSKLFNYKAERQKNR